MKGGVRAAAALGIGYVLGRNKKLRMAALMAAATAVGGKTIGGKALQRGMKALGSTEMVGKIAPQLGEIADAVRGDLVPAGKAAAGAAVSNRVDSLTTSLHDRADRLRNPAATVTEGAEDVKKTAGRAASTAGRAASSGGRRLSKRGAAAEPADDEFDERDAVDEDETDDLERGEPDEYEDEQPEDDYDEGEPDDYEGGEDGEIDEPRTPRRTAPRRRSPVSRAGR